MNLAQTPIGDMTAENADSKPSSNLRNASYTDVTRRWSGISSRQLESLVASSSAASTAVLNGGNVEHVSIIDLAYERERKTNAVGAIAQQSTGNELLQLQRQDVMVPSILQRPVLLQRAEGTHGNTNTATISNAALVPSNARGLIPDHVAAKLAVGSDYKRLESLAAQASKRYLSIRTKFQEEEKTMRQIQRSLTYQKRIQEQVENEVATLLTTHSAGAGSDVEDTQRSKSDELAQKKLENERVIAQLGRRLDEMLDTHNGQTQNELNLAKAVADAFRKECVTMETAYVDPTGNSSSSFHNDWKLHGRKSNSIMNHIIGREFGVDMKRPRGPLSRRIGMRVSEESIRQRTKALFLRRLCHVVTINTHLFCPVYCLRFDRTGRYFVTGADDNLVKLFRIGMAPKAGLRQQQRYHSRNPDVSFQRGAVLVCTLRGHAGVITDIDVSADNALLATASEDGDVRVWGMTDGCPVAILRGHEGGANMVST